MRFAPRPAVSRHVLHLTLVAVALSAPSPCVAQLRPAHAIGGTKVGDIIRFRTVGGGKAWTTMRVVDGDSASFVGVPTAGDATPHTVPGDSLQALELHLGPRSRAEALGRNLGKTALYGGATTLVLMGLFEATEDESSLISGDAFGAFLGVSVTLGVGSVVAVRSLVAPGEQWQKLPLRTPRGLLPVVRRSQLTGWNVGVKFKVR